MITFIDSFQGEYRWLSNFWPAPVYYDGDGYPSVENAYQAAKTALPAEREPFRSCTAGQAKRLGRRVTMRFDWEGLKLRVMEDLLRQKFAGYHDDLTQKLLATGDAVLVEGNTWGDRYWGKVPDAQGEGENHLGQLLMKIRNELRRRDCDQGGDLCAAGRRDGVACPADSCDREDGVR